MRITVVAKPGSKKPSVERLGEHRYAISVTAVPERGKANDAVRRALAEELHVAPSRISLVMGATARTKVFDIR